MYLYADDAKVYSTITCDSDHLHLQKVIDHIKEWCDQWLLPLNINKCSHMSYTSRLSIDTFHIRLMVLLMNRSLFVCLFVFAHVQTVTAVCWGG